MARTTVQIYEIQTPEEARAMTALGVGVVGSVLTSREDWRQEPVKKAMASAREGGAQASLIPLFTEPEAVLQVLEFHQPDIIHFCDALTDLEGRAVDPAPHLALQSLVRREHPGVRIMRSIPIARPGHGWRVPTLETARVFEPASDIFLTDTWLGGGGADEPSGPVQGFIGITGLICDWGLAADLVKQSQIPVILAGGISPENAYDGVTAVRPAGVDSCTQTNARDSGGAPIRFVKDLDRVRRLVEETRRADRVIYQ